MITKSILLIDFYDSFTYNIVHYLEELELDVSVIYHDQLEVKILSSFDAVILSPGPGLPADKKNMFLIIKTLILNKIPTLGICLGFQAITAYLNFKLNNQIEVKHGVSTKLKSISKTSILLKDIKENTKVGLYHSWYVKDYSNSQITSYSSSGIPMSFEDLDKRLFGVQFHPESVLTTEGKKIFRNFLDYLHSLNHLNQ